MALQSVDSLSALNELGSQGLDLKKASSQQVHSQLKKATGFGLTQTITKWLLIEENETLLSSEFICVRWSQTKGFIVLKKYDSKKQNQDKKTILSGTFSSELILYVDLLGAMDSVLGAKSNDVNQWLNKNFTTKATNDDKKQQESESHHKIITLKQLFDLLVNNWGEKCIKVSDHQAVNGVIEFRIVDKAKKKKNLFYESLDDLFTLLEEEAKESEPHTVNIDDWFKTNPKCLQLSKDFDIDVSLTINAMDDTVVSGQIYLLYDENDGALFFSIQYDINNENQVKFAKKFLKEFGLDNDNIINSEMLNIKAIMQLVQNLLKENKLTIQVSDQYVTHEEILFIVKDE